MNDKTKVVVPEIHFNNKSRLIMLTVARFDQGFVVRNILPKKTVALTSMGDIMGLSAQIAEALFDGVQSLLKENKAININIQLQDGQIGVIPIGFEQVNDANVLNRLLLSLSPFINKSAWPKARVADNSGADFAEIFSNQLENSNELPLVFDPSAFGLSPFNPFGASLPQSDSPFFIVPDGNDPRILNSTVEQKKTHKQYYSNEDRAVALKETKDGNKTRLEG